MDDQHDDTDVPATRRARIRMPIEDRVRPEDWVAGQPEGGVSASQQAESTYQDSRRRFETEYGAGGA